MSFRIGQGIDFHQLVEGRDLWLGGVKIPHTKGCMGHSDADVLLHAICDALLGAVGLGDIGVHFPDTDMAFKNIDSKVLLRRSYNMVREKGYWLVNIDECIQDRPVCHCIGAVFHGFCLVVWRSYRTCV